MSIIKIIKIRNSLLIVSALIMFISGLILHYIFFEAVLVSMLLFIIHFSLWSDWMYYNHLINNGAKIQYKTYQIVGLFVVSIQFIIILLAVSNDV